MRLACFLSWREVLSSDGQEGLGEWGAWSKWHWHSPMDSLFTGSRASFGIFCQVLAQETLPFWFSLN